MTDLRCFRCRVARPVNDQHWDGGVLDEIVRDAAEHGPSDGAAAARAGDDQAGLDSAGDPGDRGRQIAGIAFLAYEFDDCIDSSLLRLSERACKYSIVRGDFLGTWALRGVLSIELLGERRGCVDEAY